MFNKRTTVKHSSFNKDTNPINKSVSFMQNLRLAKWVRYCSCVRHLLPFRINRLKAWTIRVNWGILAEIWAKIY